MFKKPGKEQAVYIYGAMLTRPGSGTVGNRPIAAAGKGEDIQDSVGTRRFSAGIAFGGVIIEGTRGGGGVVGTYRGNW